MSASARCSSTPWPRATPLLLRSTGGWASRPWVACPMPSATPSWGRSRCWSCIAGSEDPVAGGSGRLDRQVDRAHPLERDALGVEDLDAQLLHAPDAEVVLGRVLRVARVGDDHHAEAHVLQPDRGL